MNEEIILKKLENLTKILSSLLEPKVLDSNYSVYLDRLRYRLDFKLDYPEHNSSVVYNILESLNSLGEKIHFDEEKTKELYGGNYRFFSFSKEGQLSLNRFVSFGNKEYSYLKEFLPLWLN